jgi:hypothetical protein
MKAVIFFFLLFAFFVFRFLAFSYVAGQTEIFPLPKHYGTLKKIA